MDELETGTLAEREAKAAREWAEQQRAAARAQFTTPSWIGPDRSTSPQIPEQVEPDHDDLEIAVPVPAGPPIPEAAHWSEKARPRVVAGTMLVLALLGVLGGLALTITTQSAGAITLLAASAIVAVIFRGALMGAGLTTIDLKGSVLRIRCGGVLDVVNLADPLHPIELVGTPDQATWRVQIEAVDGRTVEITPQMADAPELDRIVRHYQAIADRARQERQQRFSR
jgi:hypothetical protein